MVNICQHKVDTLVAELADTLHITVEQARGFRDFQYGKWPSSNQWIDYYKPSRSAQKGSFGKGILPKI